LFHNDPKLVASQLRTLLFEDGYAMMFERVDFAVLASGDVGRETYRVFAEELR